MDDKTKIYDDASNKDCCSIEQTTSLKAEGPVDAHEGHDHSQSGPSSWKQYLPALISLLLLCIGLLMNHVVRFEWFTGLVVLIWYVVAYLPVGFPVIRKVWNGIQRAEFFTEFFLMTIATLGAFAIGEYPEAVGVMLFYTIGELFQSAAVKGAQKNIKALLDVRPKIAHVFKGNKYESIPPNQVSIGDKIQVRRGENFPLDGILFSSSAVVNTAALTGESKPQSLHKGDDVWAGSINLEDVIEVVVQKRFEESSIARILELVQNATARKSKTELFIRRFAKIYTPIVVYLAIAICVIPYFVLDIYIFSDWLYRALVFLVISCPCALIISIPLGYFGGLGAASKNGILFKGGTYLDQMGKVNTLFLDKTGTVTLGVFRIQEVILFDDMEKKEFMEILWAMESQSNHPIAKAILETLNTEDIPLASDVKEIAGKGLIGRVNESSILVGNMALMSEYEIVVPAQAKAVEESLVMVAVNGIFVGYVTLADEIKVEAKSALANLRQMGVGQIVMLSGDKDSITQKVAKELAIHEAYGNLLPEDKLKKVEQAKEMKTNVIAFVGDGINDAPVLARSDVGIAMGGLGSDVAIETADVVIQTDQISKIATAISISKSTQLIIWQNIALAFGVKLIVLILGAGGLATMWEAVFADVGVALLAILNAMRLQRMKWRPQ